MLDCTVGWLAWLAAGHSGDVVHISGVGAGDGMAYYHLLWASVVLAWQYWQCAWLC